MKRRTTFGLALGLAVAGPLRAQVADLNDAINKAGRQRMLSQRMAKAYCALGQGVLVQEAAEVLAASMARFDRQLVELKVFAPTEAIKTTYLGLEAAWGEYKTVLVGSKPERLRAVEVLKLAGRVLALAHQGTGQLEQVSGKPIGRLVNVSGRQRMLSQRMAAFYLGSAWGAAGDTGVAEVNKAQAEFVAGHQVLKTAPEATPQILAQLALAEDQFTFFSSALRKLRPGQPEPRSNADVYTTSERILQVMETVTDLYARPAGQHIHIKDPR